MKEKEDIDDQVLQNLGILQSKINAVKDLTLILMKCLIELFLYNFK